MVSFPADGPDPVFTFTQMASTLELSQKAKRKSPKERDDSSLLKTRAQSPSCTWAAPYAGCEMGCNGDRLGSYTLCGRFTKCHRISARTHMEFAAHDVLKNAANMRRRQKGLNCFAVWSRKGEMTQCDPVPEGRGVYIPLRLPPVNHLASAPCKRAKRHFLLGSTANPPATLRQC